MEFKYPEDIKFTIANINGIQSKWKFPKSGSCQDNCKKMGDLKIGEEAVLKYKRNPTERYKYFLVFDSGLESDFMSEDEIEIMMGKELIELFEQDKINTHTHTYTQVQQSKPPLGVMPKQIYELQRIQNLCRALYEYSHYDDSNLESMIKWSEELIDRLKTLI